MKKILVMSAIVIAFAGCKSNPYPDGAQFVQNKPNKPDQSFFLDVAGTVEFYEGVQGSFPVKAKVPSGHPQLTFDGLPKDAVYDEVNEQVVWTPDFNAANDPNDPSIVTKTYVVTVTLKDSSDTQTYVSTVYVIVHDMPQTMTLLNFQESNSAKEGETISQDIQIKDDDFPQGPFGLRTEDLPAGSVLTKDTRSPNLFHLSYTPDFGVVKSSDHGSIQSTWKLLIYNPRGRVLTRLVKWSIYGNRQNPTVYFPQKINQGPPTVEFMLNTFDPNGEIPPEVTVDPPISGMIALDTVSSFPGSATSKPFKIIDVKWTGIATAQTGKTITLNFQSCVNDTSGSPTQCAAIPIPVYLNGGNP